MRIDRRHDTDKPLDAGQTRGEFSAMVIENDSILGQTVCWQHESCAFKTGSHGRAQGRHVEYRSDCVAEQDYPVLVRR
jgi:hypothetical protein